MAKHDKAFKEGHKRMAGRQAGVPNKVTRILRDAILLAAELEGSNGRGKDGLIGYLRDLAHNEKVAYAGLLGKVLPLQLQLMLRAERPMKVIERVIVDPDGTEFLVPEPKPHRPNLTLVNGGGRRQGNGEST